MSDSFTEYLKRHYCEKGEVYTHTRIGDKENKISGGTYNIADHELFMNKYYKHVFVDRKEEFLTEKQRVEDAVLVVDVDMRYSTDITERQHTKEHIIDLIDIYGKYISKIFKISNDFKMEVFVMEKPDVNRLDTKTKDGIHIIFGILTHKAEQVLIRDKVLPELKSIWEDLPFTNDIDDLIDEGITRGTVNWQLYGSRKPKHASYLIKYYFNMKWSVENDDWDFTETDIDKFNTKKQLSKLSVQCTSFPLMELKDDYVDKVEKIKQSLTKKRKTIRIVVANKSNPVNYKDIKSVEELDAIVTEMIENMEPSTTDYELKETHEFAMILPKQYWGSGSYSNWIRVGWALRNTSNKLLPTWLKFSSQSEEFTFRDIPELIELWYTFDNNDPNGKTARSIMYWAKIDNPIEYKKVREDTISYYLEVTVSHQTDYDFAQALYQLCKHEFVCVSIKNNTWYEYKGHKWSEIDSGTTLRHTISKKMHDIYMKKTTDSINALQKLDHSAENYEVSRKRSHKLADICDLLKKTSEKNNIMREAKELFYDKEFYTKLDNNPYLLCFKNCVVDFKEKTHRNGQPDDYLSKCTNIDYLPIDKFRDPTLKTDIEEFIEQLFPNEELRKYMWEHLASTLIGNNDNQTFNIYIGSGANGKSKLVDLMTKVLGDYKATVPITLLTQKRNQIGSTSSEIVQLMGVRYAVMQEPNQAERINEGIMKEITGGDPIQARALFKESVTFIPQFKLVVCTNELFEIKSNDDGTWRRIRVCDFESKFVEDPYNDEIHFSREKYPYQYKMDKQIDAKFNKWAPVFASMLVELTYKNLGVVHDSKIVMGSSGEYREGQDYFTEFTNEKIKVQPGGKVKKTEFWEVFKQWYISNHNRGPPKCRVVTELMNKKYGKYTTKWTNIVINYDDDDDED